MSTQIAVRLPDEMVAYLDRVVATGKAPSRAALVATAVEREMRRRAAEQAIEAAGGTLADVAQVMIYLVHSTDFARMNEVYKEYFSPPYPSRATVVVKELMGPTMRVEIVAHANLASV
mgnify:CR=1 FL=1